MLPWAVIDRRHFHHSTPIVSSLHPQRPCVRFKLSPKSLPHNTFADPHPLNLYATIFYKNCRGRVLDSGLATRHSSLVTALKSFPFILLRTLWHDAKLKPFLFKRFRTLYPKTPGVGVSLPFGQVAERSARCWQTTLN